jgi:hypothetical protein
MAPPLTTEPRPPTARQSRRALALVIIGVLVSILAVALMAQLRTPPARTRVAGASWPTAGATSPTTPAGDHPWLGTASPPTTAAATSGSAPTRSAAPSSPADGGPFCTSARTGLVSLGGEGLATLKRVASGAGDAVPQARNVVRSAVDQAARLRDAAPAALTQAIDTLAAAWSELSAALERAGYDRGAVAGLAIKYLASPVVAASWEVLTTWVVRHCGVNLVDGQPAGA